MGSQFFQVFLAQSSLPPPLLEAIRMSLVSICFQALKPPSTSVFQRFANLVDFQLLAVSVSSKGSVV